MAMDSKQDFLRNAESALGEIVTASDMNRILKALSDVDEGMHGWNDGKRN